MLPGLQSLDGKELGNPLHPPSPQAEQDKAGGWVNFTALSDDNSADASGGREDAGVVGDDLRDEVVGHRGATAAEEELTNVSQVHLRHLKPPAAYGPTKSALSEHQMSYPETLFTPSLSAQR